MKKTVSISISGRVQGVGFRYYTRKKAAECNINGFVQNQSDGSVYIEANGESVDIDAFTDWCKQGPGWAKVKDCRINEIPYYKWNNFEIR
ncbi:MAG: acylphosphatase [Bacteroidota bacterium]|jgi:acylphosphatase